MAKIALTKNEIQCHANAIAIAFRKGFTGEAHILFVDFIDGLSLFIEHINGKKNNVMPEAVTQLFNVMLAAHQRNDTLFLADILQYDLMQIVTEHS